MPNSSPPIQSEPEIPENLQGRWNYLQSEHLQDKVYPENPATINFERAYIRRIAKAESQLARYRAPVSDEESYKFGSYMSDLDGWQDGTRFTAENVDALIEARKEQQ